MMSRAAGGERDRLAGGQAREGRLSRGKGDCVRNMTFFVRSKDAWLGHGVGHPL